MKKVILCAFSLFLLLVISGVAYAAEPVLYFSDLTSGPKTGLGDGLGSGAIVTIWGANLGSTQGTSKVYVGNVEAAYVYEWTNATQHAGHPADLYTYHKMQDIAFSVPATAVDGANTIKVVVNGVTSNTLPFTIRTGNIYHVKTTGTNVSTSGSWTNPWQTMDYVANGPTLNPGDIIYVGDGVQSLSSLVLYSINGTATNPISFIAYPGAIVLAQGEWGIANRSVASTYVNFSKFVAKAKSTGIEAIKGMRIVANEITNYPGGCADGQSGAVSGSSASGGATDGGIKAFGNYIHEFGCDTTTKLHHVFYISNRSGVAIQSFELGWNYLANNKAHHALHTYDEGICGDWTGTMLIHDNVVVNQVGVGVGIASACYSGYPYLTMPVEIYNNLFINVGLETTTDIGGGHNQAISLMKSTTLSHVKIYNNTIYGYGIPGSGYALQVQGNGSADWNFGGTWEFVNNIVVDTNNLPYEYPTYWKPADIHSNNLWYSTTGGHAGPPAWDTAPLASDPLLVNPVANDYHLQSTSPAKDTGYNTSAVVAVDIDGIVRPQGSAVDIGAYEYIVGGCVPAKVIFTIQSGGGTGGTSWSQQPVVTIQDSNNVTCTNATNSITLAISANPGSGTLSCTTNPLSASSGIATFGGCKIDKIGTGYTLIASAAGLIGDTSSTFNITVGSASQLSITTQPGGGTGGMLWSQQPIVTIQDAGNNTVTSASNAITLTLSTNPGNSSLVCNANPLGATSGISTFIGCKINTAAAGYGITASASGLTSAISNAFNITVGAATKIGFTTQTGGGAVNSTWAIQPIVKVQDAGNNTVTSATDSITLAIGTNPGSGTLSCTTNPLSASSGIATFAGCGINTAGTGYTLTAVASGLTGDTGEVFNITIVPIRAHVSRSIVSRGLSTRSLVTRTY